MKAFFTLLLLSTLLFSMNNYNKGVKAYQEEQYQMALSLWMPYALDNDSQAQYLIANIYYDGKNDVEQDYEKAMKWYKKSAQAGNAKAQLKIGMMYCQGHGVLISYKKAVPYIQKSYDAGCEIAQEVWEKYKLYEYE